MLNLSIAHESWPIAGGFTISRGTKRSAEIVTVTLEDANGHTGRGECVPYPRYGESVEGVVAALETARDAIETGLGREEVAAIVEPRAGRNALDCALWDLEAKAAGKRAWEIAGLNEPGLLETAYTLSLQSPEAMARAAAENSARPLLKLKLGATDGRDPERLRAIRAAAPETRLIIDANEGWAPADLSAMFEVCAEVGIALVEQPLPAGDDGLLAEIERPIMVCADESAHDAETLDQVLGRYDAVNIKLDKTGGLTNALHFAEAARAEGLTLFTGCMLATSLSMAPAMLVAGVSEFVDLDGPLLLAKDREPGIDFQGSSMRPAPAALWG
ncbi:MAG: N-acetyl-D-Glu racemase DgcA [Pseudomonadota bacterium]